MAALRYRDEHNKVGYLQKPKGSDDYHQVLDFLSASHIRFALTHNPIIFDSLVKQFWSTATLRSPELGPASCYHMMRHLYITEESVRNLGSQLSIADNDSIDDLPLRKSILAWIHLGFVTERQLTFQENKVFHNGGFWSTLFFIVLVPSLVVGINLVAQLLLLLFVFLMGEDSAGLATFLMGQVYNIGMLKSFNVILDFFIQFGYETASPDSTCVQAAQEGEGALRADVVQAVPPPFTANSFLQNQYIASSSRLHETEDDYLGGSFHVSPLRFHSKLLPSGNASGSIEDHITLSALFSAVSTLVKKVHSLETKLKAHKKLFKDVVPKLVKKVKTLEVQLKSQKRKVVLSNSDPEEGGEPDVDLDALNALANAAVTVDSIISPGGASRNPTSDVPTTTVPTDVPSGVDPTSPSTVSPGSTTVPTSSFIPATAQIPASQVLMLVTSQRRRTCEQGLKNEGIGSMTLAHSHALQEEFDKIQRAVAFTRGLKRDGSPMSTTSSKKHKTGDNIPEFRVEVPLLRKLQLRRGRVARKGVHTSHSTIPIEEGDPDTEHKLCIKYDSDDDTLVHLYAVIDWELLPTGLGSINAIYRLDNSRKYFTSLRKILHLVTRADIMTIYGRVITFYQDKKAEGVGVINSPCYHNKELDSLEQTATGGSKSVVGSRFPELLQHCAFDVQVQQDFDVPFQAMRPFVWTHDLLMFKFDLNGRSLISIIWNLNIVALSFTVFSGVKDC
ncbi:hypothetical protein Tco_1319939 [Tanacetum coccineum]